MAKKSSIQPLLMVLLLFCGCNKVNYNDLRSFVKDNLVVFSSQKIPGELHQLIQSNRIIFLGETYYVQEHQEYVSLLLNEYGPDGLCFFNEFSNAHNWMIEDYVRGEIDHLPYTIRLLNHVWLEKIRQINFQFDNDLPLHFCCMDVNLWKDDFKNAIRESEKILGGQPFFHLIKILKEDEDAYLRALNDMRDLLEEEREEYLHTWGEKWYIRYKKLVELELESCLYRRSGNEEIRELAMLKVIESTMDEYPYAKVMINCGLYHAQKEPFLGPDMRRLRNYMEVIYPDSISSLAFIGISGKRVLNYNDIESIDFDILEMAEPEDLIRIIGEEAGTSMSFLDLSDEIFTREMNVTYVTGAVMVAPGRQFDAIVSYPETSILESLSDFGY